jgi:hypothetical protein
MLTSRPVVGDGDGDECALAVDHWVFERLLTFDAAAEDGGDGELDDEAEDDGVCLLSELAAQLEPAGRASSTRRWARS